jgi:hypothetical protein
MLHIPFGVLVAMTPSMDASTSPGTLELVGDGWSYALPTMAPACSRTPTLKVAASPNFLREATFPCFRQQLTPNIAPFFSPRTG